MGFLTSMFKGVFSLIFGVIIIALVASLIMGYFTVVGIIAVIALILAIVGALINKNQSGMGAGKSFTTLMTVDALSEISSGRLPRLTTDTIILASGEHCHFIDKAYLLHERVVKKYRTETKGRTEPSLLTFLYPRWGVQLRRGSAETHIEEIPVTDRHKGLLFITNRRIIFSGRNGSFEQPFKSLTAKSPYTDGIEFQFGSKYKVLVLPDGAVANEVVNLIVARRSI